KFIAIGDEEKRGEATLRLMREARAAAALNNEHVVRIYDVGESDNGVPFIVMERLAGFDLAEIAKQAGALPVSAAVSFVRQACGALSEAHHVRIVHRDLKPSNLFVVRRLDGTAGIKILDFGIAKSMAREGDRADSSTLTGAREALGSPHYMSPEQIRDARSVDTRADIWSLGAILFELIAGRPAFQAPTHPGLYAAIIADTPPSLSSLRPDVPQELAQIVARCLERKLDLRFQSVEELSSALEPFAAVSVAFDALPKPERPRAAQSTLSASGSRPALHEPTVTLSPDTPSSDERLAFGAASTQRAPSSPELFDDPGPRTERSPTSSEFSPSPVPSASRNYRREGLTLFGLFTVAAFAYWILSRPGPSNVPEAPLTIKLELDSEPAGAHVLERGELLGITPLTLQLSFANKLASPRALRLVLAGYKDFVVEQVPESGERAVHARLDRLASPNPGAELKQPDASAPPNPSRGPAAPEAELKPVPVEGKPAGSAASPEVNKAAGGSARAVSSPSASSPAPSAPALPAGAPGDWRPEIRTHR
ncbi:MAG TPA: serine/threonine-protein kinase, partial [Polyangiaceae bacterium]|nr:serine/threonine-protein kinase [Polyangiaceae bacterium]